MGNVVLIAVEGLQNDGLDYNVVQTMVKHYKTMAHL